MAVAQRAVAQRVVHQPAVLLLVLPHVIQAVPLLLRPVLQRHAPQAVARPAQHDAATLILVILPV